MMPNCLIQVNSLWLELLLVLNPKSILNLALQKGRMCSIILLVRFHTINAICFVIRTSGLVGNGNIP